MNEIVKHINDTNASYRTPNAGDAKNTDLFLDNEHYELFKEVGNQITVRFSKENLSKAILFIASVLPRKYDNSAMHKSVSYSPEFVYDQLAFLDYFFKKDGVSVAHKTQTWNARKDVPKKNGEIDNRFYFNGLLEEVEYVNSEGEHVSSKFTIRNYLAGGYSDLHIKKAEDGIFDVWVTNVQEAYFDDKENGVEEIDMRTPKNLPLQQIYYGAPGTGKSHKTNEVTSKYPDTVRTTFHPDSDYSTFVGAYKPTMTKVRKAVVIGQDEKEVKPLDGNSEWEEKIAYKFVKQAFLKAYVKAWKKFAETCVEGGELAPQYLVIEEINRGNCAQIFGDLFQLLDRKQDFSEYPIEADADICKALLEEDTEDNPSFGAEGLQLTDEQKTYINNVYDGKPVAEKICKGEVLVLPPNLYIWATMNTSDQSLFPIDSAFKRRWEWKYMKIKEGKDEDGNRLDWKIVVKDKDGGIVKIKNEDSLSWWAFIQKINAIIASMTSSADKQLGYFFCKADKDGVINGETFVSKVIFYLWNDVFKDYGFEDASLFRYKVKEGEKEVEKDLTFPDFYDEDGENVNAERLVDFIQKVMDWQKPEDNA